MTVTYEIRHRTRYSYSYPVTLSHHVSHLIPRPCPRQKRHDSHLAITPEATSYSQRDDYFGNPMSLFTVEQSHQDLSVLVSSQISVTPATPPDPTQTPAWEEVAALLRAPSSTLRQAANAAASPETTPQPSEGLAVTAEELSEAVGFVHASPLVPPLPELRPLAEACFPPGQPILAGAIALTVQIFHRFHYDPEATDIGTPLAEVVAERRGVCQDFAHVMIGALRSLGLAARYVSGYLLTGNSTNEDSGLIGADATHAWVSVWVPGHGWIDLDPTNNKYALDEHVVAAWGRDFDDVSPIKGVMVGGGEHTITVEVAVTPTSDSPLQPVPQFTQPPREGWPHPKATPSEATTPKAPMPEATTPEASTPDSASPRPNADDA
jgi:transglutaminase-like putative cysteine protease